MDRKKVLVVRELVKVNHHRSCLLCHAPANLDREEELRETLTAAMPIPNERFPPQPYGRRKSSDLAVRVDATYLRQDFSVYQAVADAAPWPEMQRYDFLVRERVLTEDEAAAYLKNLEDGQPGQPSPNQKAVRLALRGLTGADAGPTADAWRDILALLNR